jgi:hypothetical protein
MTTAKTKILEELSSKQLALAEAVAKEYIDDLCKPTKPHLPTIKRWLKIAYGLFDKPVPKRVEVVASPHAACKLATELTGEKQTATDYCGVGDGGWVAFYDFFNRINRIGTLADDEAGDVLALRDFSRVAWDTILLDECAIVVRRPTVLRLDDAGSLHCATGPCIEWADGEKDFAWHGTFVPERIITAPRSHTLEEYRKITNTEERRALSEAAGWDWIVRLLGASPIDAWTDPQTSLRYELLRASDGQQILAKQSPALKNKSQPKYMEPVHEDLKTARAARKWQATDLTPAQCEADPDLSYSVET